MSIASHGPRSLTHMSVSHTALAPPPSALTEEAAPEQYVCTGGVPGQGLSLRSGCLVPKTGDTLRARYEGLWDRQVHPTARHSVPLREEAWHVSNHRKPAHWIVYTFTVNHPNQTFRNKT